MPRPCCSRKIRCQPNARFFKPRGIPLNELETIPLALDEFEALRWADLLGLYQEEAAKKMGVSRATFGRIIENARRKVATALVNGHALQIGEDLKQELKTIPEV
jgi:predicted DNA-binding protein (UPF0251 family)